MKKTIVMRAPLALVLLLAACSGGETGRILGLDQQTPDEFAVVSRAPLTVPPEFGLRPPDPDGQRFQDLQPSAEAQRAVFGDDLVRKRLEQEAQLRQQGASQGEIALMSRTGALDANPNIRRMVDQETSALAAEQDTFVDDLVFWRDPEVPGDVIDSNEEARRIQANNALGQPITEGETPIITREGESSWFEWPF